MNALFSLVGNRVPLSKNFEEALPIIRSARRVARGNGPSAGLPRDASGTAKIKSPSRRAFRVRSGASPLGPRSARVARATWRRACAAPAERALFIIQMMFVFDFPCRREKWFFISLRRMWVARKFFCESRWDGSPSCATKTVTESTHNLLDARSESGKTWRRRIKPGMTATFDWLRARADAYTR